MVLRRYVRPFCMKFTQAIKEYNLWRGFRVNEKTVGRNAFDLRTVCLAFGDIEIEQITLTQVLTHLADRERLGWSESTVISAALTLRSFFDFLEQSGHKVLNHSLIPVKPKPFKIPRVADAKDFLRLAEAAADCVETGRTSAIRNRALIHLVWDTWARLGEILSLDIGDLRFNGDLSGCAVIRTEKSKGRRPIREIFWTAQTGQYVQDWIKARTAMADVVIIQEPEALFISCRRSPKGTSGGLRLGTRDGGQIFRQMSQRAGLPKVLNAHSMRHYGARQIIEGGGASADVANILGHASIEASYIYTMMWGEALKRRWERFQQAVPPTDQSTLPTSNQLQPPATNELLHLKSSHRGGNPSWPHPRAPF